MIAKVKIKQQVIRWKKLVDSDRVEKAFAMIDMREKISLSYATRKIDEIRHV